MQTIEAVKIDWRKQLASMSDKEIEILVRQRLGQADAALCLSEQPHERFNFHAHRAVHKANNYKVLALFDDIFNGDGDDHTHSPMVSTYKGSLVVHGVNEREGKDYSGWGTVSILVDVLKTYAKKGPYFNGR